MNTNNEKGYFSRINPKLSTIKHKKKIFILDGIVKYPITISDKDITCLCDKRDTNDLCQHVIYYLYDIGLDVELLGMFNIAYFTF